MGARLKATARRWKTTALRYTKRQRLLRAKLQRAQRRIAALEVEVQQLRAAGAPLPVAGHTYPAQLMALAVFIVVQANGSLRCAAKTMGFVSHLLGWSYGVPSHSSVRRWVVRCGLFQLEHASDKVGNYVAILDESIQMGREKLLLLLRVKLCDDRRHCAPLTGADVEVLGLEVQQSWTGETIAEFVQRKLARLPALRLTYCITDGGSTNLTKALKLLKLDAVSDCTHVMMNAVKKLLKDDATLSQLSADIGQLRRRLLLTAEGYLLPPTLRDKDRLLRIFTLVPWVKRIDAVWQRLPQSSRDHLSFLERARPRIQCMGQLKALVQISAGVLKGAGLSTVSIARWEQRINQFIIENKLSNEAQTFIQTMRAYLAQHEKLIEKHQRLLCCSDVIESTFGRYKNKGGTPVISADVLAVALYNAEISPQLVKKALTYVPYQAVHDWEQRYTCDNRYSLVRRMNRELKSAVA